MLRITDEEVEKRLDIPTCLRLAREAYVKQAKGEIICPPRAWLEVPKGSSLYAMPAHVLGARTIAVKLARVAPGNQVRSLPTTLATLYLFDAHTGELMAEIDGETLTAKRTAASTALATQVLANPRSSVLGVFGAGKQASAHIPMLLHVRPVKKIIVYTPDQVQLARFVKDLSNDSKFQVVAAKTPREVIESSDLILLATNSPTPVFDSSHSKPGTHLNAIGAALPTAREVDSKLVKNSVVFVDSREQALESYGDIVIPIREGMIDASHVRAELGDLVVNSHLFTRRPEDITLFKSGGIAGLDAVFAEYLLGTKN